jgi:hypothetical protein
MLKLVVLIQLIPIKKIQTIIIQSRSDLKEQFFLNETRVFLTWIEAWIISQSISIHVWMGLIEQDFFTVII